MTHATIPADSDLVINEGAGDGVCASGTRARLLGGLVP